MSKTKDLKSLKKLNGVYKQCLNVLGRTYKVQVHSNDDMISHMSGDAKKMSGDYKANFGNLLNSYFGKISKQYKIRNYAFQKNLKYRIKVLDIEIGKLEEAVHE